MLGFSNQSDLRTIAPQTRGAVMKRASFADEKIIRISREADRSPAAKLAKRHGVNEPTIYAWLKKFENMGTDVLRPSIASNNGQKNISSTNQKWTSEAGTTLCYTSQVSLSKTSKLNALTLQSATSC